MNLIHYIFMQFIYIFICACVYVCVTVKNWFVNNDIFWEDLPLDL